MPVIPNVIHRTSLCRDLLCRATAQKETGPKAAANGTGIHTRRGGRGMFARTAQTAEGGARSRSCRGSSARGGYHPSLRPGARPTLIIFRELAPQLRVQRTCSHRGTLERNWKRVWRSGEAGRRALAPNGRQTPRRLTGAFWRLAATYPAGTRRRSQRLSLGV
jgi:hypothetical protein